MFKNYRLGWWGISVVGAVGMLTGCGKAPEQAKAAPPAAVSVYQVKSEEIGGYREFVARTEASKEANLIARVEGELIERTFNEGSEVKEGDVLLKIDDKEYQTALNSAQADLRSSVAAQKRAARDLARGQEISEEGYISTSDLDKLTANSEQADAGVKVAQSNVEKAELNMGYTVIHAPFSGQIGKANYSVGNIVGPTKGTLATLIQTDPIYVSFQVEEADFISYRQSHRGVDTPDDVPIDISLRLPNNSDYDQKGIMDFADTKIEEGTGTVELRAVFPNPDGIVLPGLFVSLITESRNKEQKVIIPQMAIQENQLGKFVLVVENNKVIQRPVTLGRRINAMWVVESGLEVGQEIIIEGLQKVRAGVEVKPVRKNVDPTTGAISALTAS